MKNLLIILFLFIGYQPLAAQDLNSYKYVIVPEEFDFLREPNQFQLSELTKFLFTKAGFEAFLQNENMPEDLEANPCNALSANVHKEPSLLVTKLYVVLKNCRDQTVFTSEIGTSREKDFQASYHAALRDAFKSIEALNYTYIPDSNTPGQKSSEKISENKIQGEVKAPTPEERIKARAPKTDAVVNKPEAVNHKMLFNLNNSVYYLEKDDLGYSFYQEGITEPVASLFAAGLNEVYIYSSSNYCGVAYFGKEGNLVVELLPEGKTTPEVLTYKKISQ